MGRAGEPSMRRPDDGMVVWKRGWHSDYEPLAGANAESIVGVRDSVEADADMELAPIAFERMGLVQLDGSVGGVRDLG